MHTAVPPVTPPLGISQASLLELYPTAAVAPSKPGFEGTVLRVVTNQDEFHFIFLNGQLDTAVFNTRWSSDSSKALGNKLGHFLDAYGGRDEYEIVLDNGFGYTIVRSDKAVFALYSYACDVFSVGSMRNGQIVLHDWELRDEAT